MPDDPDETRLSGGADETGAVTPVAAAAGGRDALVPGTVFHGRYRIAGFLGRGGMGSVYRVWDTELGVDVALKIVRPDLTADPESARDFDRRFKQELLLARQVSHRNVLRIHDLGDADGVKYITMSFVDGADLAALLRDGRMPFDRARRLGRQLASGLAAAHDAGIVHRDLKPQNILIGPHDQLYISDFGLAKSLEATAAALTRPGEFLGTPRYIAPEQVEGGVVDHRVDLYAVGLILYEMLTGDTPFDAPSAIELMMKRVRERPKSPRALLPEVPEDLDRVVMRCLERDPAARYADAHEIEADLGGPASTRVRSTPAAPERIAVRSSRRRQYAVPAFAAALALVALIAVPIVRRTRGTAAPATAAGAPAAAAQTRIAVLPFKTVGDAPALESAAAGIDESLSSKLFAVKNLAVAGDAAVQRASRKTSLVDIGKDLGANLLVTGSIQGSADRIRVTAHLQDVAANREIWSQEFSGVEADLLTLEDRLFTALVGQLRVKLTDAETARTIAHPTENIDAYAAYLRGRRAMRGEQNVVNVQAAIDAYKEALAHDPSFALAYAGIADSSLRMYRATREPHWAAEALSAAQQAESLDDKLVEVHVALGNVYQATGRTAESIVELKKATELAPNSDDAYRRLGRAFLSAGRPQDAIDAYRNAVDVNPYHWVNSDTLGAAYLQLGKYPEAAAAFQRVIQLAPDNVNGYNDLGALYLRTAEYDKALDAFQHALKLQPIPNTYTNLGITYAYAGRFAEAVPMFEKAADMQPNAENYVGNLADGYRWAGERDQARAAYDKAIGLALKAIQVNPRDAATRGNLALYYAKRGDTATAQRFMKEARAIDPKSVDLLYNEAVLSALVGDKDGAFADLGKALEAGLPLSSIETDPDMRSLRSDPRFAALKSRTQ
ncbi:MAG TPA: tetratricopeptide repeat protein [Vicinamibacterales bacterium]|jgi:tetratricopeptide (TPR) repeat protein|nr:tetratricopeptide repeat protein [Vicinamibacterales bacterium]